MALQRLTTLPAWHALMTIKATQLYDLRTVDRCGQNYRLSQCRITLDFDLQFLTALARQGVYDLASESKLEEKVEALFTGKAVNFSENRAALHTALRAPMAQNQLDVGDVIAKDIDNVLAQMKAISSQIRAGERLGYSGKAIKNIINIGIGGSDLGPKMCLAALMAFADKTLNYHFISDADPLSFEQVIDKIDIETSLFIVVSKSFSTIETLINAQKAIELYETEDQIAKHFIAVTAKPSKAKQFGIDCVLPIWQWVGGRFSFCSAVNLILMIAIGEQPFLTMLEGAHAMDQHFRHTEMTQNMPIIMALLSIFNVNIRDIQTHSILVYNNRLKYFPEFLQQLQMESNGKSMNMWGEKIEYKTSPVVWGAIGNRAQHAYYQLLVQGTQKISLDFIFDSTHKQELVDAYGHNVINALSQGKSTNDWSHIEGKQPLNKITLENVEPYCLGSLIALYEHKVFIEGCIWQINSFDQFGVESAKQL